jgi:hypothetical protein
LFFEKEKREARLKGNEMSTDAAAPPVEHTPSSVDQIPRECFPGAALFVVVFEKFFLKKKPRAHSRSHRIGTATVKEEKTRPVVCACVSAAQRCVFWRAGSAVACRHGRACARAAHTPCAAAPTEAIVAAVSGLAVHSCADVNDGHWATKRIRNKNIFYQRPHITTAAAATAATTAVTVAKASY